MTNSKIFIQNTTKMIHLKKYIRKVKHAAPILYFVWQFCLNQWELIQYNLSFPFYWSRTYLSHQTSHRNVSGPQIFPLSQPYKFSDSMCMTSMTLILSILTIFNDFNPLNLDLFHDFNDFINFFIDIFND